MRGPCFGNTKLLFGEGKALVYKEPSPVWTRQAHIIVVVLQCTNFQVKKARTHPAFVQHGVNMTRHFSRMATMQFHIRGHQAGPTLQKTFIWTDVVFRTYWASTGFIASESRNSNKTRSFPQIVNLGNLQTLFPKKKMGNRFQIYDTYLKDKWSLSSA